jgi:C4-dicarboxylate-specific signal transduction histidine kinase
MTFPIFTRKITPFVLCGLLLGGAAIARADETMERHAQDELEQAMSTTGLDQTSHLKSALAYLDHLPAGFHRTPLKRARADINAAIFEAQQGDTDHTLGDDIRHAKEDIDHIAP